MKKRRERVQEWRMAMAMGMGMGMAVVGDGGLGKWEFIGRRRRAHTWKNTHPGTRPNTTRRPWIQLPSTSPSFSLIAASISTPIFFLSRHRSHTFYLCCSHSCPAKLPPAFYPWVVHRYDVQRAILFEGLFLVMGQPVEHTKCSLDGPISWVGKSFHFVVFMSFKS